MKILFTSVGRRVELMQAFRMAADDLGVDLTIIGADITESAPALFFSDETKIVCKIKEPEYIPQLLNICETEKVDCLIPTIDTDLLILAENKAKFEAIKQNQRCSCCINFNDVAEEAKKIDDTKGLLQKQFDTEKAKL